MIDGAGVGEDIYTSTAFYNSHGLLISMQGGYFFGYLDGNGCTPPIVIPAGSRTFYLWSVAKYGNRTLSVVPSGGGVAAIEEVTVNIAGTGTQTISFWPISKQAFFNISLFAMNGLRRWPGRYTGVYRFYANASSNFNDINTHQIFIKSHLDKTLVNHELGHAFFYYNTLLDPNDLTSLIWQVYDPSRNGVSPGCTAPVEDMNSLEWVANAANEGAATYYAAHSFNWLPLNADCVVYHPIFQGVSCDAGPMGLPQKHMKTTCTMDARLWTGTEIDWLRTFWNVRTSASGVASDDLLDWLLSSTSFDGTSLTFYHNIDQAANTYGGVLNTQWDLQKVASGVDP